MQNPFPGMDPYLEHPDVWHSFHTQLIARLAEQITEELPDRYYVSVEGRAVISLEGDERDWRLPDLVVAGEGDGAARTGTVATAVAGSVAVRVPTPEIVRERYLEIRESGEFGQLVTSLEVLSPSNKISGDDRGSYIVKRSGVLGFWSSLVEIDLLRAGRPMPLREPADHKDYSVLVSRGWERPDALLIPFAVADPVPDFPLPLRRGEPDLVVSLSKAIRHVYQVGRYWKRIRYSGPPTPRLKGAAAAWADTLLREKGLR